MKRFIASAAFMAACALHAQTVPHIKGVATTSDVEIGYETLGKSAAAMPVIAVNGGPGLSHVYMVQNDMWEKVARKRLVVFYDQRGLGWSKKVKSDATYTMDAQVADLEAVRAKLGLEKAAFVGDSFGGWLVMAYAAAHPEHVGALVLSDAAGPSWKFMARDLGNFFPDVQEEAAAESKKLGGNTDAAARAGMRSHFKMIFYSPEKRDAYMAKMGDLGYEPAIAQKVSKELNTVDLSDALPKFSFPTLVITGRYDANVPPINAWKLSRMIPGARCVFFEKSGHLPSYEEPERYQTVLEGFLK